MVQTVRAFPANGTKKPVCVHLQWYMKFIYIVYFLQQYVHIHPFTHQLQQSSFGGI